MKSLLVFTASTIALATAVACAPTEKATARAALDCPTAQGDLTRASVSSDGKMCLYTTSEGDEVSLRLLPVGAGGTKATLGPIEQELAAEMAPAADTAAAAAADATARSDTEMASVDAAKAKAEADRVSIEADKDAVHVELHAGNEGDEEGPTRIDLPGLHINAQNDSARVDVAGIHINAGEGGAEIRSSKDVRLKGEAFSRQKRGFRASYILARDDLKDGYKAVGYEAAGPKAGPLTVAVVKSREGHHDSLIDDVKKLVRRNAGV
jgi:hypothetical protein